MDSGELEAVARGAVRSQVRIATMVFGGVLGAFGLTWAIAATQVVVRSAAQPISPSFLPFVSGLMLAVAGLAVMVDGCRRPTIPEDEGDPTFDLPGQARVWVFFALILTYSLLLLSVHYFVLTWVFATVVLVVARERIDLWLPVKGALISAIMFFVFITLLEVSLPGSRLF
ncbi:MAG: hypothetical protein CMF72_16315 [Mameliella sp.]|nr:hypothetical protein [Mameliella sp.]|tara:strand:- start:2836 stop:3348 length:513 start_codon:yes stop_codon:yes gene_type:complete